MRDILRLGVILAIVGAVAAASLACVNQATKPIIEEKEKQDFEAALKAVVPGAEKLEKVEKGGKVFYVGYKGSEQVGVAMPVEAKGYSATPITLIVGTDMNGKIIAVKVQSQSETPGLGARITGDDFLKQFVGKTPADPVALGQDINALSGATISSRAVTGGIKHALTCIQANLLGGGVTPVIDISKIPDGTYEGEGQGFGGKIKVSVKVAGGRVIDVAVLQHTESPGASDPAMKQVPGKIVEKQSYEVDVASGATFTSKGIMEAVKNALQCAVIPQAGQEASKEQAEEKPQEVPAATPSAPTPAGPEKPTAPEKPAEEPKPAPETPKPQEPATKPEEPKPQPQPQPSEPKPSGYKDGTYQGEGDGFGGKIKVSVVVEGGKIKSVAVTEHKDTAGVCDKAIQGIPKAIVEKQTPQVDAVSGATLTSNGIIQAVQNALAKAK